ncbi:hypothetical protein BC829DRAFT_422193 [Chytridium lagenaria]|nr:hypothetical protein BC829DRAFT_422193 [Chytridium lagenaria]
MRKDIIEHFLYRGTAFHIPHIEGQGGDDDEPLRFNASSGDDSLAADTDRIARSETMTALDVSGITAFPRLHDIQSSSDKIIKLAQHLNHTCPQIHPSLYGKRSCLCYDLRGALMREVSSPFADIHELMPVFSVYDMEKDGNVRPGFSRRPLDDTESKHPLLKAASSKEVNKGTLWHEDLDVKMMEPSVVPNLAMFKRAFKVFTCGLLENVELGHGRAFVAGGAVTACLTPWPQKLLDLWKQEVICRTVLESILGLPVEISKVIEEFSGEMRRREMRVDLELMKMFWREECPFMGSDVDVFFVCPRRATDVEDAAEHLPKVHEQVLKNRERLDFSQIPTGPDGIWKSHWMFQKLKRSRVVMQSKEKLDNYFKGLPTVRTANSVTVCGCHPVRHIQLMLNVTRGAEQLAYPLDLDCASALYDGENVYVIDRTLRSLNTRTNFVDVRSISDRSRATRMIKYATRGFSTVVFETCRHAPRCDVAVSKSIRDILLREFPKFVDHNESTTDWRIQDHFQSSVACLVADYIMTPLVYGHCVHPLRLHENVQSLATTKRLARPLIKLQALIELIDKDVILNKDAFKNLILEQRGPGARFPGMQFKNVKDAGMLRRVKFGTAFILCYMCRRDVKGDDGFDGVSDVKDGESESKSTGDDSNVKDEKCESESSGDDSSESAEEDGWESSHSPIINVSHWEKNASEDENDRIETFEVTENAGGNEVTTGEWNAELYDDDWGYEPSNIAANKYSFTEKDVPGDGDDESEAEKVGGIATSSEDAWNAWNPDPVDDDWGLEPSNIAANKNSLTEKDVPEDGDDESEAEKVGGIATSFEDAWNGWNPDPVDDDWGLEPSNIDDDWESGPGPSNPLSEDIFDWEKDNSFPPKKVAICKRCNALNKSKREQTTDLTGKFALVTGGRIKIGKAVTLKLLRCGATVYALDFRNVGEVLRFTEHLKSVIPRLDVFVQNAAQTIARPPEYYLPMVEAEARLRRTLDDDVKALWVKLDGERVDGDSSALMMATPEGASVPQHVMERLGMDSPSDVAASALMTQWNWQTSDGAKAITYSDDLIPKDWNVYTGDDPVDPVASRPLLLQKLQPLLSSVTSPRPTPSFVSTSRHVKASSLPPTTLSVIFADENGAHPHTNMAKAALNRLTQTCATALLKEGVYLTAVDPGWVSLMGPMNSGTGGEADYAPPLTEEDGAARILDPVFAGLRDGVLMHGVLLSNFKVVVVRDGGFLF